MTTETITTGRVPEKHVTRVEEKRPAWPGLDGLRAIAVLTVIGFHANRWIRNGYMGVDVFFVLSGFLITTLLLRERRLTGSIAVPRFYGKRMLRLYPALVAACLGVAAISVVFSKHLAAVYEGVVASLLYVTNIWSATGHETIFLDHTWTLSLEEQFYLVMPLLLLAILRFRFLLPIVVALLVAVDLTDGLLGQPAVLHSYIRAGGLVLGCILAAAPQRWRDVVSKLWFPAAVGLIVIAVFPADVTAVAAGWPISLAAVLTVPIVAAITLTSRPIPVLGSRLMGWIGARSYGLYLWHFVILSVALNTALSRIPIDLRMAAGIIASFVAATLSYRWVETPFLRLKDRVGTAAA